MFFCTRLPLFLHHVFCSYEFKVPQRYRCTRYRAIPIHHENWKSVLVPGAQQAASRPHVGIASVVAPALPACAVAELYGMGPGTGPGAAQEKSVTAGSLCLLDSCKGSFQFLSFIFDPVLISSEHKSKQTGVNNWILENKITSFFCMPKLLLSHYCCSYFFSSWFSASKVLGGSELGRTCSNFRIILWFLLNAHLKYY